MKSLLISFLCSIMMISAAEKPNFLFVFADDMSLDTIGAYGRYNCKTPHLDKLMKATDDVKEAAGDLKDSKEDGDDDDDGDDPKPKRKRSRRSK